MNFDSSKIKKIICDMVVANGYSFRDAPLQGDDFRIFLTPPGSSAETVEMFKEKGSDAVCCGAGLVMGGEQREKFLAQAHPKRKELKESLKNYLGYSEKLN